MGRPTEVELTAKKWKLQILLSVLAVVLGMIIFAVGMAAESPALGGVGGILFIVGFVWFIFARVMAWWHHG